MTGRRSRRLLIGLPMPNPVEPPQVTAAPGLECPCCSSDQPTATATKEAAAKVFRMEVLRIAREIRAPIGAVWSIVSDFGGVQRWIPDLHATVVGSGPGSVRSIVYPNGHIVRERLDALDSKHRRVRYSVIAGGVLPVRDGQSTIELSDGGGDGWTLVDWAVTALQDDSPDLAEPVSDLAGRTLVRIEALRKAAIREGDSQRHARVECSRISTVVTD